MLYIQKILFKLFPLISQKYLQQMNQQKAVKHPQISLITFTTANLDENKPTAPSIDTMEVQSGKDKKVGNQVLRVKSKGRKIAIGLIISLSALMFGYSIKEITSVPIATLVIAYDITMNSFVAQSILIGILPIGALFGAIITKVLIKRFRRLLGIYIFTVVNIGAVVLININTFTTLILGRFLEGICIGYYSAIAPIYLREIAPKELRRMLGLFFSFGKNIGVLVAVVVELILDALQVDFEYRILLSLTALFSVLQAVLIFFFGSDTPTEMIEKGKRDEALDIIKKFYQQKYVQEVFNEYTEQYEAELAKGNQTLSQKFVEERRKRVSYKFELEMDHKVSKVKKNYNPNEKPKLRPQQYESQGYGHVNKTEVYSINAGGDENQHESDHKKKQNTQLTFEEKKSKAFCLGTHLCVLRHFIGGNALITQGGLFIAVFNAGLGKYTALIINLVQFFSVVFGLVYLQTILGKKPLFLLSLSLLSLLDLALVISMIFENVLTMMMIMCIYMVIYGAGFISPVWAYPSEIIPASDSLIPNIVHWIALALSTLIPPIIQGVMPDSNPYPAFIFFGIYGLIGFVHVRLSLKESDGLTYRQIVKSFK